VPQLPQLFPSVSRLAQTPAQLAVPSRQAQMPPEQMEFPAQMVRHWPQWNLSVERSAQVLAQVAMPEVHWSTQMPALHSGADAGQTFPHIPQLVRLVRRSTQLPTPPKAPAHWV